MDQKEVDQKDKRNRARARLSAIKAHLPSDSKVPSHYVDEFHAALKHLSDLGIDVKEFEVSGDELRAIESHTSSLFEEDEIVYSKDRFIERSLLLIKIDSVLAYLQSLN